MTCVWRFVLCVVSGLGAWSHPALAQQPPAMNDIIAAASAQNHVFQIANFIGATEVSTGEDCSLSGGDLAKFNRIPNGTDDTAEMKVLTSRPGSCKAGSAVEIRIADLQDMLVAFSKSAGNEARIARAAKRTPTPLNSRALQIVEPWQSVEIEHSDRKNRLVRLSNLQGVARPDFYEYEIDQSKHHLADYPTRIPVLRVVFRDRVFFDFDKDEIKPQAQGVIETIAESLRHEVSDVSVFVTGHTDAIGSANYNLQLGLRRSRAVASELVEKGVAKTQVFVVSFGEAVPIASNDSDEGRAQNRRVEFLFSARPEPIAAWLVDQPFAQCKGGIGEKSDDCVADLRFTGVSVDVAPQPKPVALPGGAKTVPLPLEQKSVVFGTRTVTIDLAARTFSFPPPEGGIQ